MTALIVLAMGLFLHTKYCDKLVWRMKKYFPGWWVVCIFLEYLLIMIILALYSILRMNNG